MRFPTNIEKLLKIPILKNSCERTLAQETVFLLDHVNFDLLQF